jgi:hypothetical protein
LHICKNNIDNSYPEVGMTIRLPNLVTLESPSINLSIPSVNEKFELAKVFGENLLNKIEEYWLNRYILRKYYRCYDFDKNLNLREHFKGDVKVNKYISMAFDTKFEVKKRIREIKKEANYDEINKRQLNRFLNRMEDKINGLRDQVIEHYFDLLSYYGKILQAWASEIIQNHNYQDKDIKSIIDNSSSLSADERNILCEYYLYNQNQDLQKVKDLNSLLWIQEFVNIPPDDILNTKKRFFTYVVLEFNLHKKILNISKKELYDFLGYDDMKSVSNFVTSLNEYEDIIILKDDSDMKNMIYKFIFYDPTKFSPTKLFTSTRKYRFSVEMDKLLGDSYLKRHSYFLIKSIIETNKLINGNYNIKSKEICNIINVKSTVYTDYQSAKYNPMSQK